MLLRLMFAFLVIAHAAPAACPHPWVFFDLGETLVDTKTHNYEKIYYLPGAYDYLKDLRAKGFKLGMLVNYPDQFGSTEAAKIAHMIDFIAKAWWVEKPYDPKEFDWNDFDAGIHVPPHDADYKPKPFLFQKAIRLAAAAGCRAVFQGEDQKELKTATTVGMIANDVADGFLPPGDLDRLARAFRR